MLRYHLLSSRQAHLCGGERGIDKVKEWALQEPVSTRAPRYKNNNSKKSSTESKKNVSTTEPEINNTDDTSVPDEFKKVIT